MFFIKQEEEEEDVSHQIKVKVKVKIKMNAKANILINNKSASTVLYGNWLGGQETVAFLVVSDNKMRWQNSSFSCVFKEDYDVDNVYKESISIKSGEFISTRKTLLLLLWLSYKL